MILADNDQTLIPLYHKVIPKLNGKFRTAQKFRPLRILLQILTVQLAFWFTFLLLQFGSLTIPSLFIIENPEIKSKVLWPNLDFLFEFDNYSIKSILKSLNCINYILVGFISAYYLKFIIKRSKLCLDFTLTCHLIHLVVTCVYNKEFPINFVWWTTTILSAWLMTERSRLLCLKVELLPIGLQRSSPEVKRRKSSIIQQLNKLFKRRKSSDSGEDINVNDSKCPLNPK